MRLCEWERRIDEHLGRVMYRLRRNGITIMDSSALCGLGFLSNVRREERGAHVDGLLMLESGFTWRLCRLSERRGGILVTNEFRDEYGKRTFSFLEPMIEDLASTGGIESARSKAARDLRKASNTFLERVGRVENLFDRSIPAAEIEQTFFDLSYEWFARNPRYAELFLRATAPAHEANDERVVAKSFAAAYKFPVTLITADQRFEYIFDGALNHLDAVADYGVTELPQNRVDLRILREGYPDLQMHYVPKPCQVKVPA